MAGSRPQRWTRDLIVSNHAIERLRARAPWLEGAGDNRLRLRIREMHANGVRFGGQYGRDYSLLAKYALGDVQFVLVCTVSVRGKHVVKTILTLDLAIANIVSRPSVKRATRKVA